MKAMNIPEVFISWVLMLHDGVKTRLLLDFVSKPINLTFSVRQGDPIAMICFCSMWSPCCSAWRR